MSLSSRRKKSYDDKLRRFQNRNIFAGIVLAIAVGFAIWLMVAAMSGSTPKIYLSTNYINYSGTQKEIPFAVSSCEKVVESLGSQFKFLESDDPLELDSNTSQLQLNKNIRNKDILIAYFNGHLVRGIDEPVEYLPSGDSEGSATRGDFGAILKNINDSSGKLKILLIDAGRFTRSPVFPARECNDFQDALTDAIARNEYQLDDNFWIIVSHSKHEFSRVSTPMECSLFSQAVSASVEHFADKGVSDLSVLDFFLEVRKRTSSWSRNLKSKSTQNPILLYPGKGIVFEEAEFGNSQLSSTFEDEEKFRWKVAFTDRPEENPEDKKDEENVGIEFKNNQPGQQAAQRLLEEHRYDALPRETVASLERFLELGEPIGIGNARRIGDYADKLSEEPDQSQGTIIVESEKLQPKQTAVREFRRAVLGVTVLARFQNELRHWQDDEVLRYLGEFESNLPELVSVPDSELTDSENVPPRYTQYTKAFDDFYRRHADLFARVNARIEAARGGELQTPTQAEMLGRMSERYLPIIVAFKPGDMDEATDEEKQKSNKEMETKTIFLLDLEPNEGKGKFEEDMNVLYNESKGAFGSDFESLNDTAFRFRLAAQGLEGVAAVANLSNFTAAVPNIKWKPLTPGVNLFLVSGTTGARVNPANPEPIEIAIDAEAVTATKLEIAPQSNPDLGRLQYSFYKEGAGKEKQIQFNGSRERKAFELWFKNKDFDEPNRTIPFVITATWEDGGKKEFKFDVTLTKEADFVLTASRKLGKGISKHRLMRWDRRDFPDDLRPLMVKTLANIESGFDLSIQNKSRKVRNLTFSLYNIRKDLGVRPDRAEGFGELSGWLAREIGDKPLRDEFFELLGKTKDVSIPAASDPIRLEFAKADPDPNDDAEPVFGLQEVSHCLLLVGTDVETKKNEWFQWIGFEPKMPADYTANMSNDEDLLSPLDDIAKGVQLDDEKELKRQLGRSWPKKVPVARLAVVSPNSGRKPGNQPQLSVEGVFAGQELSPGKPIGSEQRILVMELFGVPAYRVLRQSNDSIVRFTDRDLVGLKVETEDSGCFCHPTTWSLLNFDASGKKKQTVFVRSDPSLGGDGELEFKFLLPHVKGDALASDPVDYAIIWNGGEEKRWFPNSRKHSVQIGENGLSFMSAISSHELPGVSFGNIADESVLEVIQKATSPEGQDRSIGIWEFKKESFGDTPKLKLSGAKVTKGNLADVIVEADISKIRSPVEFSSVKLLVDGKVVKQFFKKQFGKGNAEGIYRFNLGDLPESVELGVGSHGIEIAATDFFGDTITSDARKIRVMKAEKQTVIVPKVEKKVFREVRLNFPVAIGITNFQSLKAGNTIVPWTNANTQKGIVAARKKGYLKVFRIPEGRYTFTVTAKFLNDAETEQTIKTFKKTVDVNKEGQIVELE